MKPKQNESNLAPQTPAVEIEGERIISKMLEEEFKPKKHDPDKAHKKEKKRLRAQARRSAFVPHKKRTMVNLLIIGLVGIISGIAVGIYLGPKPMDPNRYNFEISALMDDVSQIKRESQNKTPTELGATKSCVLAFDTTFNYERVCVIGEGSVKAAGVVQSINAKTIRNGNKLYYENISVSKFVKALNRYYVDGQTISHYGGSLSGKTVTWKTTPDNTGADDIKTMDAYKAKYGSTMFDYMTYIVSSKTVISASSVTQNAEGNFEFTLTLDKSKAVVNYVKTMKDTGGLKDYPDFTSDPVITLVIDSNWRILSFHSEEKYTVSMGISAKSEGELTNTFSYDEDFEIPKLTDKSSI